MNNKLKWILIYTPFGILCCSFLGIFGLDAIYAHNPQNQNPGIGRIFVRVIKYHGEIYLTKKEYEPYEWLYWIIILSIIFILFMKIVLFLIKKFGN